MSINSLIVNESNLSRFCELTKQNQEVVNKVSNKDVTMLLGPTGAGKSTTANVLCGCKPVEDKIQTPQGHLKKVYNTVPQNGFKPMQIGHSLESTTLIAGVAQDPSSGMVYVDGMGHKDNRGWEYALANAANIVSILKSSLSSRLLVVIPAASVHVNRGESIAEMFVVLDEFLQNAGGLTAFSKSILVLITKANTMEDVNNARAAIHAVNNSLQVIGLSFEDKSKARYVEAMDETEFHPGTLDELKNMLQNNIQPVSFRTVKLQAPITNSDRQVLMKLQSVLKSKMQQVGFENIEKAIVVYNAFCFLKAIECDEVDAMLNNMQAAFLEQFQQCISTISQQLIERNIQGALQTKNKLEQALKCVQQHSPKLSQFVKDEKILEKCDHLYKQVQQFEEELKAEKIARENALREKQAAEQKRKDAEKAAAIERENNEKAQEAYRQEQKQRVAQQEAHAAELVSMAERQRQESEKRAEIQRQENLAREEAQRQRDAEQREIERQREAEQRQREQQMYQQMSELHERVARAESSRGGPCTIM